MIKVGVLGAKGRMGAQTCLAVEEACRQGRPWAPDRPPIIILNRRISNVEITALRACGLDFRADYRLLAPTQQTMDVQVWVPRSEAATKTP